jgi:hypothetical protein
VANAPRGYAPSSGSNNRKLVILRGASTILTYAREQIGTSTYGRGDLVSRIAIRNEPFDQARSVTETSGTINVGTTNAR